MSNFMLRGFTAWPIRSLMNSLLGHYVTIYMIHRPSTHDGAYGGLSAELLENAIIYAKNNGFEFAALDDVIADAIAGHKRSKPTLCFTLDDGYQDQLDVLVPILLKHQCKPTLFVLIDMIENLDWPWDSQLAFALWSSPVQKIEIEHDSHIIQLDLSNKELRKEARRKITRIGKTLIAHQLQPFKEKVLAQLMVDVTKKAPPSYHPASWDQLRKAEAAGLRIGSHACSHRVFTALTTAEITEELTRAKVRLTEELTNPSAIFCYPSGTAQDFLPEHAQLIQKAGYGAAVTSISGNTNLTEIKSHPFEIKRHSFPTNLEKFIRYSSWLEYIRSRI